MPATSTRTSTCRTEARGAPARLAAFLLAGILPHAHCEPLRLDPWLRIAAAPGAPARATYEELLVEVDVNNQGMDRSILVLRRGDGMFFLKAEDLAAFRLKPPSTAPYLHDGTPFFPIATLPGGRFVMDEVHQSLKITAAAEAFESTRDVVPGSIKYPEAVRPSTGGFLNYDIVANAGAGTMFVSDLMEGGFFTPYGVLVSNAIATHGGSSGTHAVRLESTFTSDFPGRHTTLRVGDSVTRAGAWGNLVRFGGVQFGTNFATEPGFRAFPTQALRGQAVVPSVVDVYVNNALVASRRVDPGPFTIANVPFATGGGTVRLAVRDIAGQQQIVTVSDPFYSSNTLLKAGLSDYSAEVGKVRENFGLDSASYGEAFASGTFRHGISDRLTAEARVESTREQHAAGVSASTVHPWIGQLDLTLAASHSPEGTGRLAGAGFQRQYSPLSFGGQALWASRDFHRIGQTGVQATLRLQEAFSVGLQVFNSGSATASYVAQNFYDGSHVSITSLGYSMSLGRFGQLNLLAIRSRTATDSARSYTVALTVPLDLNTSVSAQYDTSRTATDSSRQLSTSFQRNRNGDSPYSYRVTTRGRDAEGIFHYRGDRFETEVGLARTENGTWAERAELSGGFGYVSGYPFLSRRITGSFGVVQVADYPNVGILFDNQFVGRTDERGFFVIPELRAYDRNTIGVRDIDLPMDAEVASLKLDAAPYFRSGILIRFPVRRLKAGVLYLTLEDGSPLPSGAVAHIEGQTDEFPVALNGELYVNGFGEKSRILATWKGQTCAIDVVYPRTVDPLPDLGRFVCRGVRP